MQAGDEHRYGGGGVLAIQLSLDDRQGAILNLCVLFGKQGCQCCIAFGSEHVEDTAWLGRHFNLAVQGRTTIGAVAAPFAGCGCKSKVRADPRPSPILLDNALTRTGTADWAAAPAFCRH